MLLQQLAVAIVVKLIAALRKSAGCCGTAVPVLLLVANGKC